MWKFNLNRLRFVKACVRQIYDRDTSSSRDSKAHSARQTCLAAACTIIASEQRDRLFTGNMTWPDETESGAPMLLFECVPTHPRVLGPGQKISHKGRLGLGRPLCDDPWGSSHKSPRQGQYPKYLI